MFQEILLLCWTIKKFVTRDCVKNNWIKEKDKVKNWRNLIHCLVINLSDFHATFSDFVWLIILLYGAKFFRFRRDATSIAIENWLRVTIISRSILLLASRIAKLLSLFSREKSRLLAVNDTAIFSTEIVAIKLRLAWCYGLQKIKITYISLILLKCWKRLMQMK